MSFEDGFHINSNRKLFNPDVIQLFHCHDKNVNLFTFQAIRVNYELLRYKSKWIKKEFG